MIQNKNDPWTNPDMVRSYYDALTVEKDLHMLDLMETIKPLGIITVQMDVTNQKNNQQVIDQIIADKGRIDVLIRNAGFGLLYGSVEAIALDDARYQFEVNLYRCIELTGTISNGNE